MIINYTGWIPPAGLNLTDVTDFTNTHLWIFGQIYRNKITITILLAVPILTTKGDHHAEC